MAKEQPEDEGLFRISPKMLIRAAAFFQGKCLANFEDIGYSNIDEVTKALVSQFPADIPDRSMVQFKIVNLDNGRSMSTSIKRGRASDHFVEANKMVQRVAPIIGAALFFSRNFSFSLLPL